MIRYRADWVVPISQPPIRDGWVAIDRGRVVALGPDRPDVFSSGPDAARAAQAPVHDLGAVALMPGLVNAHTHLELSHLRDLVPPAPDFVTWVRHVMRVRGEQNDPARALAAVERAIDEATASGTAIIGDISNTLLTVEPLAASRLAAVVFYELIRFSPDDPERLVEQACRQLDALATTDSVRASLAAHAPYSVAPQVFRAIRRALDRRPFAPCSVHLSESCEEVEFIATGAGPWRRLLEELGAWNPAWVAPGVSPVRYLDEGGFLDNRVLAVHGVQASDEDLDRLARRGATLVACPRSNGHTGAGAPPLTAFYRSGVRVAVGTDSLASTPDLNVFAEIATMRALAPGVPASALLESATQEGARALGFESEYGSIDPGKRARLLVVGVPPLTWDVEEYLVSGIHPEDVRWVE